ncbi:MAG: flagellar export protein FliJ [Candidatus Loosdrechtia sp.]|uniref:flagellar export protein FliJ n=1 Tax=Candidatus Loosdrechtia sp. TaxID=3101272 RepID=UPI003A746A5A|nr:MAG: flagellar FliJ family protein [Candidatus Jettenia sp. AMX2]
MKQFHFKLQPLLDKERMNENECAGRLKNIQNAFLNEKNKSENLWKRMMICQGELKSKKGRSVTQGELITYENYFLKLNCEIKASRLRVQKMVHEMKVIQDELWKIVKKRKALEKLRDRWEEEHKNVLEFLSNKEMDDIAMTKFANNLVMKKWLR